MPPPAANSITPQRVAAYGLASTAAAAGVVVRAFRERSNFYAATVWLGRSNGCMLVLLNFALFVTLMLGKVFQQIFFGRLRAVEVEHLYERSWYSLSETLLAMTLFRDEFDVGFVLLFGTLLFLKVFHWLSADRVEFMEQTPSVSNLFHARMVSILGSLLIVDVVLVTFAVEVLLFENMRLGIMVLFASEFIILTTSLLSTIAKYVINCQDLRSEEPWEAKSMYVFYVDLATDFLKLATYVSFFILLTTWYGLPLSLIRDLYVTGRSCIGKVRDLIRYRAATRNMDSRYPDATHDDMRAMSDGTCIICREDMVVSGPDPNASTDREDANDSRPSAMSNSGGSALNATPKKLPCGHIFHFHCLRSWLERQQSCPTCRRTVFDASNDAGNNAQNAPQRAGNGADRAAPQPAPPATALPQETARGGTASVGAVDPTQDGIQNFLRQIQARNRERASEYDSSATTTGPTPGPTDVEAGPSSSAQAARFSASANGGRHESDRFTRGLAAHLFNPPSPSPWSSFTPGYSQGHGLRAPATPQEEGLWMPPPPSVLRSSLLGARSGSRSAWNRGASAASMSRQGSASVNGVAGGSRGGNVGNVPKDRVDTLSTEGKEDQKGNAKEEERSGEDEVEEDEEVEEGSSVSEDPIDAREAVRQATLKRFATLIQPSDGCVTTASSPTAKGSSGSGWKGKAREIEVETVDTSPWPANGDGVESTGVASSGQRGEEGNGPMVKAQLIPLFDTRSIPDFTSRHASNLPFPLASSHSEGGVAEGTKRKTSRKREFHRHDQDQDLPLANLESLTEEELEILSKSSRRGLEQRLEVLNRVQGVVWNLVEQLTLVLSVLPPEVEDPPESPSSPLTGLFGDPSSLGDRN